MLASSSMREVTMNRVASKPQPSHTIPRIVARFDLANEHQRRLHDLLQRFHAGRWPLFRCLGMRQIGGELHEAAEWAQMNKPTFSVICWRSDGLGLSWQDAETAEQARAMLKALK